MEEKVLKLLEGLYPDMSEEDKTIIIEEFGKMTQENKEVFLSALFKRFKVYVDNTKEFISKTNILNNKLEEIKEHKDDEKILQKL